MMVLFLVPNLLRITLIVIIVTAIIRGRILGGRSHRHSVLITGRDPQLQLGRNGGVVVAEVSVATNLEDLQSLDESEVKGKNAAEVVVGEIQVPERLHLGNELGDGSVELVGAQIHVK